MKIRAISAALAFYAAATIGDWGSSFWGSKVPGILEANIFYRDEAFHWVWHKAATGDALYGAVILVGAACLWKAGDAIKKGIGEGLACLPLIWFGFDRLYVAVVPNILFALHFDVVHRS